MSDSLLAQKPKLWVVSELYYPEETSTGYFLTKIAESLTESFEVHAICAQPTYSERGQVCPRRELRSGVSIYRSPSTHFDKDRLLLRALNMVTLTVSISVYLVKNVTRGDKVLVVTNPPTLMPFVGAIARIKKAESFLLVHDVYPDILVATNMLKTESRPYKILHWFFNKIYRLFHNVVVLGRDMQTVMGKKVTAQQPIHIIPNWGDTAEIEPSEQSENHFVVKHNLKGKTVIQYSGNIGRTHDVDTFLKVAKDLNGRDDIVFMIVGTGGKIKEIEKFAATHGLKNILLLPRQSRELLSHMLSCATASVISFEHAMYGLSVPSRMYNTMAAGVPIIAMANKDSELALLVAENNAGWVLDEGSSNDLKELVLRLATADGHKEAIEKGRKARSGLFEKYTLPHVTEAYQKVLGTKVVNCK